jgi:hypothetical protein
MRFNVNAKELLALHDLLEASGFGSGLDHEDVGEADAQLRRLHNRIRVCIGGALQVHGIDPVDAFFDREQAKIDALNTKTQVVDHFATPNAFHDLDDEAQVSRRGR